MTEMEQLRSLQWAAVELAGAFKRLDVNGHIDVSRTSQDWQSAHWLTTGRNAAERIMALNTLKPQKCNGNGG